MGEFNLVEANEKELATTVDDYESFLTNCLYSVLTAEFSLFKILSINVTTLPNLFTVLSSYISKSQHQLDSNNAEN